MRADLFSADDAHWPASFSAPLLPPAAQRILADEMIRPPGCRGRKNIFSPPSTRTTHFDDIRRRLALMMVLARHAAARRSAPFISAQHYAIYLPSLTRDVPRCTLISALMAAGEDDARCMPAMPCRETTPQARR